MTSRNTPLSNADTMVYAISGCLPKRRMFLPGTRFDPERAGINATIDGSLEGG